MILLLQRTLMNQLAKLECSLEIRWQKSIKVNFLILMVEPPLYNVVKWKESGGGAGNGPSGCNLLSYDLWGEKKPQQKTSVLYCNFC